VLGSGLGGWLAPKLGIKAEKTAAVWAVAIGGAVYLVGAVVIFRDAAREFFALLRQSLGKKAG